MSSSSKRNILPYNHHNLSFNNNDAGLSLDFTEIEQATQNVLEETLQTNDLIFSMYERELRKKINEKPTRHKTTRTHDKRR